MKKLKIVAFLVLAILGITSVTSCNNEDDTEELILHRNYVQGKLNNQSIAMNDINANIISEKSNYVFVSRDQTDNSSSFDWEVTLIESKDSVVTLHLHLDDVSMTNKVIYSPNEADPIKTNSTCYATVKDLKSNTTSVYHPTHLHPINVRWETLMFTASPKKYTKETKDYSYTLAYRDYKWPGIDGTLYGVLTSDDASKEPLNISLKFILY